MAAGKAVADIVIAMAVSILMAGKWLWEHGQLLFERCLGWISRGHDPRKQKSSQRLLYYTPTGQEDQETEPPTGQDQPRVQLRQEQLRLAGIAVLAVILMVSLIKLGAYGLEYMSAKRVSDELRAEYYAAMQAETPVPTSVPVTPTPMPTATVAPVPRETLLPQETAVPVATPRALLEKMEYPQNPHGLIRSRFQKLQRQNKDIIGWLTIPDLIDEAVVQRDNSYYLRRDYRGYHNDNGAIFMEESCNLATRPYTILLYGHNMKSGAMFGSLRNYEKAYFYRNNPFVTFDTVYEDGRYVIFAVGTLSQKKTALNYVDINGLVSVSIARRETAISHLRRVSVFSTDIEVAADDQLLVLITCVDDDTERRFVAARRVRDGETEAQLQKQVDKTHSR